MTPLGWLGRKTSTQKKTKKKRVIKRLKCMFKFGSVEVMFKFGSVNSLWLYGSSLPRAFHFHPFTILIWLNVERDIKHQVIIIIISESYLKFHMLVVFGKIWFGITSIYLYHSGLIQETMIIFFSFLRKLTDIPCSVSKRRRKLHAMSKSIFWEK